MSVQASIDISFVREQDPSLVLAKLLGCGWSEKFNEEVMFLPVNGFDDYDWTVLRGADFDVAGFLEDVRVGGRAGIVLVFNDVAGGEFLISKKSVSMSLSINRVVLVDRVPDFSWYISRMLPAFRDLEISSIQCEMVC
ncbi:hypothetical protein [Pseudomonas sp.]|uniref:hypothetical protein n=1 Tax=Pseudomonas sp. TaxID=306 RepID=UPI0031E1F51A